MIFLQTFQVHYEDSVKTAAFLKIQTVLIVHWESWQKDYHYEDSSAAL